METRPSRLFWVYGLVLLLEIGAEVADMSLGVWMFKPLLMPLLIGIWWQGSAAFSMAFRQIFLGALFFSWLGDIFLMLPLADMFICGLGAFLIAHIAYIVAFKRQIQSIPSYLPFLAFGMYAVGFLVFLYPHLQVAAPELLLPVAVYATVIAAMGSFAWLRKGQVVLSSFQWVCAGAVLFMFSDSCIAYSKFVGDMPFQRLAIMLTYGLGQAAIVWGVLKGRGLKI